MNEPGDWSEQYRFRQFLGQGGMGVIYLAEDKQHQDTLCVIKQLILSSASEHDQLEGIRLFKREVQVLQSLNHPGIVHFLGSHASTDGQYFLVMDYVPGKTLENIVKEQGKFSSQATVEIAIQCSEILEYLHRHNPPIIYRDLKPSNIMLKPDGQVVFIDFGIARSFQPRESATRVISAGYSPPEQYFGKPELRSDLYALGATMFYLLTAVKPQPLITSAASNFNKSVMPSLDQLIKRLTAHAPEDRPESAQTVRYELYHIYREIEPDFSIPDEALFTDWRRQHSKPVSHFKPRINVCKNIWKAICETFLSTKKG